MNKELEALEDLIETIRMFGENQIGLDKFEERYTIIKQALLKAQEQEKVLEIIFKKNVDMYSLRRCETVEEYNTHFAIDALDLFNYIIELRRLYNETK